MAVLTGYFQSQALSRKVSFTAILPTTAASIYDPETLEQKPDEPLSTLYLLHGWDGNHEDWLHNTRIVELAIKYNIAIILADGQNSFYVDHANGDAFGQYIGEELVRETRQLFHLSQKRGDTAIGGLSMGGYGALRNGLYYEETFGSIMAFSSKLLSSRANETYYGDSAIEKRLRYIIGSATTKDLPADLDVEQLVLQIKNPPKLFLACGTEDQLITENRTYHQYLVENDYPHEYMETTGGHDWSCWNQTIQASLEWLYGHPV